MPRLIARLKTLFAPFTPVVSKSVLPIRPKSVSLSRSLLGLLTAVVLPLGAAAQSTIYWNFNTAAPTSGLPGNVSGGTVSQGNNNGTTMMLTSASTSGTYSGASAGNNAGAAARIDGLVQGANGSAYFEFTLTPAPGVQLQATGIAFGSRSTGTGPLAYAVYSSLDGYAAALASGTVAANSVWALQSPAFSAVTGGAGTAITFRIYGYGGAGNAVAGTANWRIDDLQFTINTVGGGGPTAPQVSTVSPSSGATNVNIGTVVSVTFDQGVTVADAWYSLTGSISGPHAATFSGGPITYTLTPMTPFAGGETVTLTVFAAQVTEKVSDELHPAANFVSSFTTALPAPVSGAVTWNFEATIDGVLTAIATPNAFPTDVAGGAIDRGNNNNNTGGTTPLLSTTSASTPTSTFSGSYNAGAAARIGALNKGDGGSAYFEFTLTPADDKQFSLTGITFGSRSTGTGPQKWALFTSLDGYVSEVAGGDLANNSSWTTVTLFPLSGLTSGTGLDVTFRLYGYGGSGGAAANTANWRIDDLKISGTTAVGIPVPPAVVATTPANGATGVLPNATVNVTFNRSVIAGAGAFTLVGSTSGAHTVTVSGGPKTFTLAPTTPLVLGETVQLTVNAAGITTPSGTLHPVADYTANFETLSPVPVPIHTVQGSGLTSTYANQAVVVHGIVVASFQNPGGVGGYYIEAPQAEWDIDPATSEGILVFDNANSVTVGDLVSVVGTVVEFGSGTATETELSPIHGFSKLSSGHPLPPAMEVTLPFAASGYAERYEGMLVTFPQALTVTDTFDLGHFGELMLSNGRLPTPTNVVVPGAPAQAQLAANLLNQVMLDDGISSQYPSPTPFLNSADPATATRRSGSTTAGVTGVFGHKFGSYVVEPTIAPVFAETNPRTLAPAAVGGSLRISIGNVLNLFNGNGAGSGFPTSRGADTLIEYERQLAKTVAGITAQAPDIMGLTEVENDGYGPTSALAQLVAALNAAAPAGTTYDYVNATAVDIVTDQIHCAFIYRVETVATVGAPAMLNDPSFNGIARNPLAQTFREKDTGAVLTISINHFKSKGSATSDPGGGGSAANADIGDGQGASNHVRKLQAQALVNWLTSDPTGSGDPDFLIIGDLNAYAKEDPIAIIEAAGYVNITEKYEGIGGYSYAFDAAFGHLDHALANASLVAQITGATTWHVNSDEPVFYDYNLETYMTTNPPPPVQHYKDATQEAINAGTPYRYSDHDPVVVGLNLTASPTIVTQPVPQSVTVGNSVTFEVVAKGSPAPTYQWRKGGIPIGGATANSYAIGSPVVADAGSYDVVVTNSVGTATSNPATLTVNPAPATVAVSDLSHTYDTTGKAATVTTTPAGVATTVTYNGDGSLPVNAGSYAVVATLADPNYSGAPASGTLTIAKATATVSLANLSQVFDGSPKPVTASTTPSGLLVDVMYNGSATAPTNVGSYPVVAAVNEANYTGTASGTLVISAFAATVVLDDLAQSYDGTPKPVTVTTTPANLTVTVTYNGSATPPTYPGAYAVVATVNDANYAGSVSDTLFIATTVMVRHAPTVNGIVDGSVQVLLPESATLNSNARITSDLLLPGKPTIKLNGSPVYGGTIDSTGASTPTNHIVTLNSGARLRHVVRRVDALAMPTVSAPPVPAGTRNVTLNSAGQSAGDFATLRNLTLNGNVGAVPVPAGTYGTFIANGSSSFVLGVAGATTPAVYNLQGLTLNSSARITLVGPAIINLAGGVTFNGSIGAPGLPDWLELNVASGGVTLNGSVTLDGFVLAPNGTVIINGGTTLNGGVIADRLTINSGGLLNEP